MRGAPIIGDSVVELGGCEIKALKDDARPFASGVGVVDFGSDGAAFAGHQRDVVVVVNDGENAVTGSVADCFEAEHEGWRR